MPRSVSELRIFTVPPAFLKPHRVPRHFLRYLQVLDLTFGFNFNYIHKFTVIMAFFLAEVIYNEKIILTVNILGTQFRTS